MGQETVRNRSLSDSYNWKIVPEGKNFEHKINPYSKRTLLNTFTNQHVQQYELQFNSKEDLHIYQQKLEVRREVKAMETNKKQNSVKHNIILCPYIYKIKYFLNVSTDDICFASHRALLYATKVDLRLKQLGDIGFYDQIYLIKATLEGFKCLYETMGFFDISREMIFISKQGKVRVWINPNLSSNQPYCVKKYKEDDGYGSQADMIVKLMAVIDSVSDNRPTSIPRFQKLILGKDVPGRQSFYNALEQFRQYCKDYKLIVKECIQSIYELYSQEQYSQMDEKVVISEVVQFPSDKEVFDSDPAIGSHIPPSKVPASEFNIRNEKLAGCDIFKSSHSSTRIKISQKCRQLDESQHCLKSMRNIGPSCKQSPFSPLLNSNNNNASQMSHVNQLRETADGHPRNVYERVKMPFAKQSIVPPKINFKKTPTKNDKPVNVDNSNIFSFMKIAKNGNSSDRKANPIEIDHDNPQFASPNGFFSDRMVQPISFEQPLNRNNSNNTAINHYLCDNSMPILDLQIAADLQKFISSKNFSHL